MLDSGTKLSENRIHLFDPVGLINDSYGGTYRSSSYATKPRRPTKSYGNFEEVNTNGGLKSYDSFKTETNGVVGLRSYDSFTDPNNKEFRSYDSFSMKTNVEGTKSLDQHVDDKNGVEIRFGVDNNGLEDETEVSTPRLWKPSSPTSPKSKNNSSYFHPTSHNSNFISSVNSIKSTPFSPTNNSKSLSSNNPMNSLTLTPTSPPKHDYHQNISPSSRTQAIAKGRRELMDMVRDLPESFYELSLKDIVEQRAEFGVKNKGVIDIPEEKKGMKDNGNNVKSLETKKKVKNSGKKVKKSESKKKMVRSKKVDNGRFLLRTSVFPIFSGSKKNKRKLGGSSSLKIAPMSRPKPSSSRSMKVAEKDWWTRKTCISSEGDDINGLGNKSESSESSGSSSRSSSNNGRRSNRFLPNCCLFNGSRIRNKK